MNEYKALRQRNMQPYSDGHQRMYLAPVQLLANKPADILDIGSGIGWGLTTMLDHKCVRHYVGIEPERECVDFCRTHFEGKSQDIRFIHAKWPYPIRDTFDVIFCIEVLEHIAPNLRPDFIGAIRVLTGQVLFLSTPNKLTSSHGELSPREVIDMLHSRGFNAVYFEWQWTTFFMATPA